MGKSVGSGLAHWMSVMAEHMSNQHQDPGGGGGGGGGAGGGGGEHHSSHHSGYSMWNGVEVENERDVCSAESFVADRLTALLPDCLLFYIY